MFTVITELCCGDFSNSIKYENDSKWLTKITKND